MQSESQPFNRSRQAREAENILDHITDRFDDNPQAMEYFYDLFRRVYCQGEEIACSNTLIGTTCIQVPEELIYAVGATPVRLCNGSYHYDQIGGDFMPAKSCSLVKATLGMLYSEEAVPRIGKPKMIINTATCDQKKKSADMLRSMGHEVYDLDLPSNKESPAARIYWRESVHDLAHRLSEVTGNKLTGNRLKAAMVKSASAPILLS